MARHGSGMQRSSSVVFLNYRRSDSAGFVGRLVDHVERHFSGIQFFRDIDKISPGDDFEIELAKWLKACDFMLTVIGPHWITEMGPSGRRIDDPKDWVRRELATALARNVAIIPVLVGGAAMPQSAELPDDLKRLSAIQAHEITAQRWDYDVQQLANRLLSLRGFRPETKLDTIDREWDLEKKQYVLVDKEGKAREPTLQGTIPSAVIATIFGLFWFFFVVGFAVSEYKNIGLAAALGGVLFSLIGPTVSILAIVSSNRQRRAYLRFKGAQDAYQSRRAKVLAEQQRRPSDAGEGGR